MRRIAVVMTYYDREYQLRKTLQTIAETEHDDYYVVIVDDASPKELDVRVIGECGIEHGAVAVVTPEARVWKDVVPFNIGLGDVLEGRLMPAHVCEWEPDVIVMQNAECYHAGDVLSFADEHVTDDNFIAFACWNLSRSDTFSDHDIHKLVTHERSSSPPAGAGAPWYHHPNVNPRYLHFCVAMTAGNMRKLNGLDERFMHGRGYDDNDLVRRYRNLGLKSLDVTHEHPFVVHQWHAPSHRGDLARINLKVWDQIRFDREEMHNYRARHIITEDFE